MSTLYLVRHGQARFLTDDYDRLSDLGRAQSRLVGQWFAREGVAVDRVWTGTLQRQRDTASLAREAAQEAGAAWPAAEVAAGLDEYPAEDIQKTIAPQLAARDPEFSRLLDNLHRATEDRERYRWAHLVLESVMDAWVHGEYDAPDLLTWSKFSGGVRAALQTAMSSAPKSSTVVAVTSGGPIGVAVQSVLQAPQIQAAKLNWRVYNASLTRFTFSGARVSFDQFNAMAHLADPKVRTYR